MEEAPLESKRKIALRSRVGAIELSAVRSAHVRDHSAIPRARAPISTSRLSQKRMWQRACGSARVVRSVS
eukprot:4014764-Pleurochrysis_carterae.AAC.2